MACMRGKGSSGGHMHRCLPHLSCRQQGSPQLQVRLQVGLQQRVLHGHRGRGHLHVACAPLLRATHGAEEVREGDGRAGVAGLKQEGRRALPCMVITCHMCLIICLSCMVQLASGSDAEWLMPRGSFPQLRLLQQATPVHHPCS